VLVRAYGHRGRVTLSAGNQDDAREDNMKKPLFRIASVCGFATLYFGSPSAHAFCTEFELAGIGLNCTGEGHRKVTNSIEPFVRDEFWNDIWRGNRAQDFDDARDDGQRHFESCRFATDGDKPGSMDYIRQTYHDAIANLNPVDPDPALAATYFGNLLHTAQDFYSHSNWINLLNISAPALVNSTHLIDNTVGEWRLLSPLGEVQAKIIVGQIPASGVLPDGWSVSQSFTSEIPVFKTPDGDRDGLIVGWNPTSACPDVRDDRTIDGYSHSKELGPMTRTLRLTHGESKIAGQTDFIHDFTDGWKDAGYQADRPCHDGYPTYVCLQKDTPGRPDYGQAIHLAEYQTANEWCRLLNLTKNSFGYSGSSILMTMWTRPGNEAEGSAPHPITTACGTPPEVLAGKPGPIEVTVNPRGVGVNSLPQPDGPPGKRFIAAALYTGDFRRSIRREYEDLTDNNVLVAQPMTMCVKPGDTVVASVWGWDDWREPPPEGPQVYAGYRVLRGETLVLHGPGFQKGDSEGSEEDRDLDANFQVIVEGDDQDSDGLSACGEQYYGTAPLDPDTDHDGLMDGAEVNTHHTDPLDADTDDDGLTDGDEINTYGTNPLDTDTDDDGLTDGDEINTYGTNPANADSDGDGLNDGDEVNKYKTDPNDADTDDDLLPDGIEVKYSSNPLLRDTDGDGLPDGKDVEWIQVAIAGIPSAAIKPPGGGNRNAMMNLLDDAEALLRKGNRKPALDKLTTLRVRIDGCGAVCDSNDWIVNCTIQTEIRKLVDLLIANVRA
jgi:hypothetical protein